MMVIVMSNVPELRFGEFSGEWNKSELNDLIEISSKKFNPKTNNENKKCIELEHLSQGTGELLGFTYSNKQESNKNAFEVNQVLFGKLRPYLKKFFKPDFDGVCSSEIWVLNGKKIANNYLFQLVQTNKFNQIANVSSGSKMPRSDWKYMAEIPFSTPLKPEQEKIASFLSSVDAKIEQLSKKKKLLQEYKKGAMQKIFSQEIRFKDENGSEYPEWENREFEKFGKFYYGKGIPKTVVVKNGKNPCVRYGELYSTHNEIVKEIKSFTNLDLKSMKLSKGGEVLIPRVGEKALDFAQASFLPFKGVGIGEMISVFETKENGLYLSYFINSMLINSFAKLVEGGSVSNLYFRYLEKISIPLPSLKEQTKIANFLSSIDAKIELSTKELDATKEFKKALLQKMFV